MNINYEWQKFRATERMQERMQEVEAHHQAKQADGNRPAFVISIKLALLAAVGLFLVIGLLTGCTAAVTTSTGSTSGVAAPAAGVDSEQAAAAMAARWQAMGRFYQEQALLNFDYEQSAEAQASRWQAMARFYEQNNMLNFDYEQSAEAQAFRWQAMANFYEEAGLLTH